MPILLIDVYRYFGWLAFAMVFIISSVFLALDFKIAAFLNKKAKLYYFSSGYDRGYFSAKERPYECKEKDKKYLTDRFFDITDSPKSDNNA